MHSVKVAPVETGSLSARTYQSLRQALISGQFSPGHRLLMQDLAQQLGTSVTPVREACYRLVSEQALELRSNRFVVVPPLTRSRYMQIRVMRIALEGLAASIAAEHSEAGELAKIADCQKMVIEATERGDVEAMREANLDFHFGVYRMSGMKLLVQQIENLWVSMGPILNVYYNTTSENFIGIEEHENLLSALSERDSNGAREAVEADIVRGGEGIIRHLNELEETE